MFFRPPDLRAPCPRSIGSVPQRRRTPRPESPARLFLQSFACIQSRFA